MKIWVDDIRPAPEGYVLCRTVNEVVSLIPDAERYVGIDCVKIIDLDHDAGDFAQYGGDYIKILDWLEETGRNYPIRIHSMNPVGVENMRRIIRRNGWMEVH